MVSLRYGCYNVLLYLVRGAQGFPVEGFFYCTLLFSHWVFHSYTLAISFSFLFLVQISFPEEILLLPIKKCVINFFYAGKDNTRSGVCIVVDKNLKENCGGKEVG